MYVHRIICILLRNTGVEVYDAFLGCTRTVRVVLTALHADYPELMVHYIVTLLICYHSLKLWQDSVGHQKRGYFPCPYSRIEGYFNTGQDIDCSALISWPLPSPTVPGCCVSSYCCFVL